MGRIVQNWKLEPVTEPLPYRTADYSDCERYRQARETSPYKEGDVLLVNIGTEHDPLIKRARILNVLAERMPISGNCIPLYRVQTETAHGVWSKLWCYVYPGHIYRAYHDIDGKPHNYDPR